MALVFAQNEETESGITYEDRTGVSYQYPRIYRRIIRPGERFLYYRGRKRRGGGRALQVYFGAGLVGDIRPDPSHSDRFICDILDYRPFPFPVAFKDEAGAYFESGADRRGYFQRGVRVISERDFQRILSAAGNPAPNIADATSPPQRYATWPPYASPETIAEIEEFSTRVAMEELGRHYCNAQIELQQRNNPGFDILVHEGAEPLFVVVKGTGQHTPQFLMTEGEIQFSRRHGSRFLLLVVYAVDPVAGTYQLFWHEGAVFGECFHLRPVQWSCEGYRGRK